MAELAHAEQGMRAPVACVTWASVSNEVAQRLATDSGPRLRLKPDEWSTGPNIWLIDTVGESKALGAALNALAGTAFKSKTVNVATRSANGDLRIENLHSLLSTASESAVAEHHNSGSKSR